jgi:phosphatidylglycerol:prolipoprotein diacylglycerol transferase
VHPVLFTIPGLQWEVQSYGFFVGLALLLGWVVSLRLAEADRLPPDRMGTAYVLSAAFGLLAARGGWLIWHPDEADGWRALIQLQAGGLQLASGAVVAALASWIYCGRRKVKVPTMAWLDSVAPAFAIGIGLERIGAFLAGSAWGKYVRPDFALAVTFPEGSPAFAFHRTQMEGLLPAEAVRSLTVHPTQLYALVVALAALGVAMWLRRRRAFSGQVFLGTVAFVVAALALTEEWLRADAAPGAVVGLNPSQLVSLGVAATLIGVYRGRAKKAAANPGKYRAWEGGPWSPEPDKK